MPSLASDTCFLYLSRHGATANNLAKPPVLQGRRTDPALCEVGHEQAAALATLMAEVPLDAVFSSPLLRARQTAQAVAERHGLPVEAIDDFTEVDVGEWEEKNWDEIMEQNPVAYERFITDPSQYGYLGGENLNDVADRVLPAFERLLQANRGRRIFVAAHNMVNRLYLADLMQVPRNRYRLVSQDNCSVNIIRLREGNTRVMTLNSMWHLEQVGR